MKRTAIYEKNTTLETLFPDHYKLELPPVFVVVDVFSFFAFCFFFVCFRSLCLSQHWTLFEINHFIKTNNQLFYVYLKHSFLCQYLDFSRRFIGDFPRSLLHMTTSVLKIFSNILVNDVFLECCDQHST